MTGALLGASDLHLDHAANRELLAAMAARPDDWLLLAGDVATTLAAFRSALETLVDRFARVVWAPGNHELHTPPSEPGQLRGAARYARLVSVCRSLGVLTPEDPYPVWDGPGGPLVVAPLFTLYDYSFTARPRDTREQSLARAETAGIVCTDEFLLHPDPHPSREDWCRERVALTERRLREHRDGPPLVLVGHWPLIREPTRILRHPEFAQWCGTTRTSDWHRRFPVHTVVYGHLHVPRRIERDGVGFEEVSLGYPREWQRRRTPPELLRRIAPR